MLTTQTSQKTLGPILLKNLISNNKPKCNGKLNYLIYASCFCLLLIMSSLPCNAQIGTLTQTPTSTATTLTLNHCHIDDWTALKALYESTGGDNWKRIDGWDEMIARQNKPTKTCNLSNLQGVGTNTFGRVRVLSMPNNNMQGNLPNEIGLLKYLEIVNFGFNNLSGSIPYSITNIFNLDMLYLGDNELTGNIPDLSNVSSLNISENRFNCDEIDQFINSTNITMNINYSPQRFAHEHEPFVADTNQINNFTISFDLTNYAPNGRFAIPQNTGVTHQWVKNEDINPNYIPTTTSLTATLHFDDVQPSDAGRYELYIYKDDLTIISEPIYVIYPGYDFEGQPVETNQIMVEFDSPESTEFYEDEILFPNAGLIVDQCNCNRELYLWQFPGTEEAMDALIEIDSKGTVTSNDDGEVDGGLNNVVRVAEPNPTSTLSYNIGLPIGYSLDGTDEVNIFMLDTGVEYESCITGQYMYNNAPVDDCYTGTTAPGYGYINENGLDDDYEDEQGHGTFGHHLIKSNTSDNIKIIPLKVFTEDGQGNLFDLTCGIYHGIDHGADIINVSAGYYGQSSSIFEKAIKTALEQEVFICAAAGNEGINIDTLPQYPASYAGLYNYQYNPQGELIDSTRFSNVISVASLGATETAGVPNIAEFSNVGAESVTLACFGHSLSGMDLGCQQSTRSGTSMATFVVSGLLAAEIANDASRSMDQILNDFDNSMLISENNLTENTITGKRLNVNLGGGLSVVPVRIGQIETSLNAGIVHTSMEVALLTYNMPDNGKMHINIFDVNGRHIQPVLNAPETKGNQQLELTKSTLQSGVYFLHMHYQSDNGDEKYHILKLPVLK